MAAAKRSGRDAAQPDLLRMARFLTGSEDVAREPTTAARHEAEALPGGRRGVRRAVEQGGWFGSLLGRFFRGMTDGYLAGEAAGLNARLAPPSDRCRRGVTMDGTAIYATLPPVTGRHRNRALAAARQARAVELRAELLHTAGWSVAVAAQGDRIPEVWSALTTRGALVG